SPSRPPTPIQFSGAHSRKSNAPSPTACSAGSSPRRRPRSAACSASAGTAWIMAVAPGDGSRHAAALAFAALAFHVGLAGRLVRVVFGLVDETVAVGVDRGEPVALIRMRGVELDVPDPAVAVGSSLGEPALRYRPGLVYLAGAFGLGMGGRGFLGAEQVALGERVDGERGAGQQQAAGQGGAEGDGDGLLAGLMGHGELLWMGWAPGVGERGMAWRRQR